MKMHANSLGKLSKLAIVALLSITALSCKQETEKIDKITSTVVQAEKPEYFLLRPELEKKYGYTQAVRIGKMVKIGGVISIDDQGKPTATDDYFQQMKNCYAHLEKVLNHYGCTFDDVVLENIYTTSMAELQRNAAYRHEIYKNHFPTGSWIGINELGLPEMMIEIEIEALVHEN